MRLHGLTAAALRADLTAVQRKKICIGSNLARNLDE